MLLTGWDSASGITPPASSSSSVASTSFSYFPPPSVSYFIFPFLLCFARIEIRIRVNMRIHALSLQLEVLGTFWCLAVVPSHTVIFLSVDGNCLCILSDRYFGLDGCHGGIFLVAGLCYIVLCFTVPSSVIVCLLSSQLS